LGPPVLKGGGRKTGHERSRVTSRRKGEISEQNTHERKEKVFRIERTGPGEMRAGGEKDLKRKTGTKVRKKKRENQNSADLLLKGGEGGVQGKPKKKLRMRGEGSIPR